MDFSGLPLPGTYEVIDASLELSAYDTYQSTLIAVGETTSAWSESSVFAYPAGNNSTWAASGGYSGDDYDVPFNPAQWVNSTGTVAFNVTALVQHALASNSAELDVVLFPVEWNNGVAGRVSFASSDATSIDLRPRLNLTYRTIDAWTPSQPTGLLPADGATLWDLTKARPSGMNSTNYTWNLTYSNHTQIAACGSDDPWFLGASTVCWTSGEVADGLFGNDTIDMANNTYNDAELYKGDVWQYWRVRADQGDRIGEWSTTHKLRVPTDQGSDDGNGNNTLNLSRGSIFESTGLLPNVLDVEIDSNSTVNRGGSNTMVLGVNSLGTGQSRVLMEFDLTNIPWPTAMTPT